jgi:translation initiation factor 1A
VIAISSTYSSLLSLGGIDISPRPGNTRYRIRFRRVDEKVENLSRRAVQVTDMSEDSGRKDLRMPDDDEVFAVVTNMLGANRVKVRCMDGTERTARIPGKMQKRIWIREDDVVLVEPWDWQDEKADITWRYEKQDADQLREEGHITE